MRAQNVSEGKVELAQRGLLLLLKSGCKGGGMRSRYINELPMAWLIPKIEREIDRKRKYLPTL